MLKRYLCLSCLCFAFVSYGCNESRTQDSCVVSCLSETILSDCVGDNPVETDCSDDNKICSDNRCIEPPECTEAKCQDDVLLQCNEGHIKERKCRDEGMICEGTDCIAPLCTQNTCKSSTLLEECHDGRPVEVNCDDDGKICDVNECITPECTEPKCKDDTHLDQCNGGKIVPYDCADDGLICAGNACVTQVCTEDVCDENGVLLYKCNRDSIQVINCAEEQKMCDAGKCTEISCTANTHDCHGDLLYACDDGKFSFTDCSLNEQICNPILHGCEYECEPETFFESCTSTNTARICDHHHITSRTCDEGYKCSEGECIEDGCLKCTESQYCLDGVCLDEQPTEWIGMPCECRGEDCFITVSGLEFKKMFKGMALLIVDPLIKDNDVIRAPNYFSASNKGCEALEAVVPEGMTVGCFRDGMLEFPSSIMTLMGQIPGILRAVNINSELVTKILPLAVEILKGGIHFTSPNGYCMTAAIDISATIKKNSSISKLVNEHALEKSTDPNNPKLVDYFNTGDHAVVVEKSAELGDSYCPEGSTLFSYTVNRTFSSVGDINTGFDICLKTCISDDDCRTDYQCVDIPTRISLSDPDETKKACFDKRNTDYIAGVLKRAREALRDDSNSEDTGD